MSTALPEKKAPLGALVSLALAIAFYLLVWAAWELWFHPAGLEFFRAAATVLPTLLVALTVSASLLKGATHARRGRSAFGAHIVTISFLGLVGWGEAVALYTLGRTDEPTKFGTGAVVAALVATFVALLYFAITREVAPQAVDAGNPENTAAAKTDAKAAQAEKAAAT